MNRNIFSSRILHSVLFLAILTTDGLMSGLFLQLVHFRALTGWEDELAFDSLLFNWRVVHITAWVLTALALAAVLISPFIKNFYRRGAWGLAPVFLLGAVYPWGLAFHYVRSFHFILLFGILMNAYAFIVLAFLKRRMRLVEPILKPLIPSPLGRGFEGTQGNSPVRAVGEMGRVRGTSGTTNSPSSQPSPLKGEGEKKTGSR